MNGFPVLEVVRNILGYAQLRLLRRIVRRGFFSDLSVCLLFAAGLLVTYGMIRLGSSFFGSLFSFSAGFFLILASAIFWSMDDPKIKQVVHNEFRKAIRRPKADDPDSPDAP